MLGRSQQSSGNMSQSQTQRSRGRPPQQPVVDDDESQSGEEDAEELNDYGRDLQTQQPAEERRRVREGYRDLLAETEANRNDMTTEALMNTIQKANSFFGSVCATHEATLDSKLLIVASDIGVQKAHRMRLDGGSFAIDDWIGKLTVKMNGQEGEEGDDEGANLDWHALGKLATRCLSRVPTIDFMLGPLAIEPKQRTQNRRVEKLVKNKEDLQKPQQLKEGDFEKQQNETTELVMEIARCLYRVGRIPFFKFIINPESFGQTVENLFYLSFLIRDGKVQINEDDEYDDLMLGTLWRMMRKSRGTRSPLLLATFAEPAVPPNPSDYDDNQIKRYQAVIDIDQQMWRDLIDAYKITETCIPTRRPTTFATAANKWYS
ncbi:Nse4 C-terminal-domain-containing protein [Geranomyces variabilis]|nr:Nse4 C-terminal-domain-containing protein [Geranomyces variabilis]KAJ3136407.1 nuclear protein [Geranomyces variabilis]